MNHLYIYFSQLYSIQFTLPNIFFKFCFKLSKHTFKTQNFSVFTILNIIKYNTKNSNTQT